MSLKNRAGIHIEDHVDYALMHRIAKQETERKTSALAITAYAYAIADCPKDTGNLAASHYIKRTGDGFELGVSADYAPFVMAMPQSSLNNGRAQWFTKAIQQAYQNSGLVVNLPKQEM